MAGKDDTISATGITVVLKTILIKSVSMENSFIRTKFNNSWYEVPVIIDGNYGFNSIGYELSPGDSGEWEIDWDWLYGSLEAGQYRIIKDILDFRIQGF